MDLSNQLILKDFDTFLDFLNENAPLELTNEKGLLKSKYLLPLNEKMQSFQTKFVTDKHKQDVFTLINTFFFVAEKAQIVLKKVGKKYETSLHLNIEKAKLYDKLTDNEKYIFLLDAFWNHISWEVAYDSSHFWGEDFYRKILKISPKGKKITIGDRELKRTGELESPHYNFVAEMMQAFGLIELEWDDNLQKRASSWQFPYKTLAVKPLGYMLLPVIFPKYSNIEEMEEAENNWFEIIQAQFPNLNLQKKLLPLEYEYISGTYQLKVMLNKKCYRVISIGGGADFVALHYAIINAFDFDDDHLYAFYMNGMESGYDDEENQILSPNCNDGVFYGGENTYADEILVGKMGLFEGKTFLYVFDFGDRWQFNIVVEKIIPSEVELTEATVIASLGESPEQYRDWEED